MKGPAPLLIVVAVILAVPAGLYMNATQLMNEQDEALAQIPRDGPEEPYITALRNELETVRETNRRQRRGFLVTGVAILAVIGAWSGVQIQQKLRKP